MLSIWATVPGPIGEESLILRHSFSPSSYTVQICDMSFIFSETLNKHGIFGRAEDEDSPIDPSSGSEQMQLLLSKLKDGLDGASDTKVTLESPSLYRKTLKVAIELPTPLPALHWSFDLRQDPEASLANELIRPLLATAYARKEVLNHITQLMSEKDAAITKIVDKLESSGADLGSVFPAAMHGKHGVRRAQLMQNVRGLRPFNFNDLDLFSSVGGDGRISFKTIATEAFAPDDQASVRRVLAELGTANHEQTSCPSQPNTMQGDADSFQRQPTPPRLRKPEESQSSSTLHNSKSQKSVTSVGQRSISPPITSTSRRPSTRDRPLSQAVEESAMDDSTADEDDDDDLDGPVIKASQPSSQPPVTQHSPSDKAKDQTDLQNSHVSNSQPSFCEPTISPSKPPRKLGRLGNVRAKSPPQPPPASESEDAAAASHETTPKKPRLGRLGGRQNPPNPNKTPEPALTVPLQPPPATEDQQDAEARVEENAVDAREPQEQPAKEETAESRAERKRAELKRALEEKARAGGKKKRRF